MMKINSLFLIFSVFLSLFTEHRAQGRSLAQQVTAAQTTAKEQSLCKQLAPFYWEIGNSSEILAAGSTGDGSVTRGSEFAIASASKWVFGAYIIQKLNGKLDATTQKFLKMMAGYTHLDPRSCIFTQTVADCLNKNENASYSKENENLFFYNGGHFQRLAVNSGLGTFNRQQMVTEYQKQLGDDFKFSFGAFQMAGGLKTTAQDYAVFLKKILSGKLLMQKFLGANPTCTFPQNCPQAVRSPIRKAWHYSYAHWVEDDPSGDGAFSSPGAFGFYPWIDATKTYYGVISRRQKPERGSGEIGQGAASARCGGFIRKAFMTGVQQ